MNFGEVFSLQDSSQHLKIRGHGFLLQNVGLLPEGVLSISGSLFKSEGRVKQEINQQVDGKAAVIQVL